MPVTTPCVVPALRPGKRSLTRSSLTLQFNMASSSSLDIQAAPSQFAISYADGSKTTGPLYTDSVRNLLLIDSAAIS